MTYKIELKMVMKPVPLNSVGPCPKCGNKSVIMWYHDCCQPGKLCYEERVTAEHMHRQCERCKFEWLEGVLQPRENNP